MFGLGKKPLVTIRVSAACYDEIASVLCADDHNDVLDMSGVGLVREPEPVAPPKHRPISKNTAPGAI